MRFGLQINQFTWPGGAAAIGPTLARVGRAADDAGFDSIWVRPPIRLALRPANGPIRPVLGRYAKPGSHTTEEPSPIDHKANLVGGA